MIEKSSKTTHQLIKALADGQFHSGQELGTLLGMTRSGIWKAVRQLRQQGLDVCAVTGKGYRASHVIELFDKKLILNHLTPDNRLKLDELQLHTRLNSTNDFLLKTANHSPPKNIACLAEHQSAGRGRQGKSWQTRFSSGVCLSLLWHFNKDPSEILGLTLSTATAVTDALVSYGVDDGLELKWPNDILYRGSKLAGILIDMIAESHNRCSVIIGVGLNIHPATESGVSVQQPWTTLSKITQKHPQRNKITGLLLNQLIEMLQQFNQFGLKPFLKKWHSFNTMHGKKVSLATANGTIQGTMCGISERGELILSTKHDTTERFLSGEVSLRLDREE